MSSMSVVGSKARCSTCPSTLGGWALLCCLWLALVAIVCIPLATQEVVPDLDERAPFTENECTVVSTHANAVIRSRTLGRRSRDPETGARKRVTYVQAWIPVVHVILLGQNTSYLAMRYRDEEDRLSSVEAEEFLRGFPVNSIVPCYQFNDGTVKLDRNPPDLSIGTYAFLVITSLGLSGVVGCFGTLLVSLCCSARESQTKSQQLAQELSHVIGARKSDAEACKQIDAAV